MTKISFYNCKKNVQKNSSNCSKPVILASLLKKKQYFFKARFKKKYIVNKAYKGIG